MPRFGVVDVQYPATGGAWAALVVASDVHLSSIVDEYVVYTGQISPYEPGRFFARELPPILSVVEAGAPVDLLVIDGYVDLDPTGRPGLGAHVHEQVGLPVVGIAKTAFRTATHALTVRRGSAQRPLYVTAAGLPLDRAAAMVLAMAGPYRIPDAVRRADTLARSGGVAVSG